jgi:hypothetical protein
MNSHFIIVTLPHMHQDRKIVITPSGARMHPPFPFQITFSLDLGQPTNGSSILVDASTSCEQQQQQQQHQLQRQQQWDIFK